MIYIGKSKFNVTKDREKRTYGERCFDSILEKNYYANVVLPAMESGEIVNYELQVPFVLQQKFTRNGKVVQPIKYIADFVLTHADGHVEVIDTKGMPDTTAILKRKMFWYHYPDIEYKWISYTKVTGWIEYDELKKIRNQKRKERKRGEINNGENEQESSKEYYGGE